MIDQVIASISSDMYGILDESQMQQLIEVLAKHLSPLETADAKNHYEKSSLLPAFISAKRVEG